MFPMQGNLNRNKIEEEDRGHEIPTALKCDWRNFFGTLSVIEFTNSVTRIKLYR